MKGNVGMSPHEKEGEQGDAYTKTELIYNPIPTSLFACVNILLVKKISLNTVVLSI